MLCEVDPHGKVPGSCSETALIVQGICVSMMWSRLRVDWGIRDSVIDTVSVCLSLPCGRNKLQKENRKSLIQDLLCGFEGLKEVQYGSKS